MILIPVFFTACAKPPVEEMNRAIEALTRAENDYEAVIYAGNTLNRARESLLRMQEEAGSKRYEIAKTHAADVITYSERAVSEGRAASARQRDEASLILNNLRTPLSETETAVNNAKANNIQADFDEITKNLDMAKAGYDDAQRNLSDGNYQDAIIKGLNVRSALSAINTEINEAAQIVMSKK